uniref:C2H2-type domain-containing protein n=1 Tax=Rhizophagus irregularis (strain DAOM 181602 / DAOM 197198 / MUCL 43194) TaxID=747089 RepID=U9V685_RHIID
MNFIASLIAITILVPQNIHKRWPKKNHDFPFNRNFDKLIFFFLLRVNLIKNIISLKTNVKHLTVYLSRLFHFLSFDEGTMSESVASITPFVCKWFGCHSKRFSTQVDLEYHVYTDHQDLNKLKTLYRGLPIYNCPWEGCKYRLRDISKFREHLLKHTQQRPFKCPLCPICNDSRQFETLEELNQHLILNHNDSVVDHSGAVDNTNHEKLEKGNDTASIS